MCALLISEKPQPKKLIRVSKFLFVSNVIAKPINVVMIYNQTKLTLMKKYDNLFVENAKTRREVRNNVLYVIKEMEP